MTQISSMECCRLQRLLFLAFVTSEQQASCSLSSCRRDPTSSLHGHHQDGDMLQPKPYVVDLHVTLLCSGW